MKFIIVILTLLVAGTAWGDIKQPYCDKEYRILYNPITKGYRSQWKYETLFGFSVTWVNLVKQPEMSLQSAEDNIRWDKEECKKELWRRRINNAWEEVK